MRARERGSEGAWGETEGERGGVREVERHIETETRMEHKGDLSVDLRV